MAKKAGKKKGGHEEETAADHEDQAAAGEAAQEAAADVDEPAEEPGVQLPAFDPEEPWEYLEALGIAASHVLAHKRSEDRKSVTIVTRGGVTLTFPGDEERALKLTESQRDGEVHQTSHTGHLFKK